MAAEGPVKPAAQSVLLAPCDSYETPESRAQKPRLAPSARGAGGGPAQCGPKCVGYIPAPCTIWCVDSRVAQTAAKTVSQTHAL